MISPASSTSASPNRPQGVSLLNPESSKRPNTNLKPHPLAEYKNSSKISSKIRHLISFWKHSSLKQKKPIETGLTMSLKPLKIIDLLQLNPDILKQERLHSQEHDKKNINDIPEIKLPESILQKHQRHVERATKFKTYLKKNGLVWVGRLTLLLALLTIFIVTEKNSKKKAYELFSPPSPPY